MVTVGYRWHETDDIYDLMSHVLGSTYVWEGTHAFVTYSTTEVTLMSKPIRYEIRDDKLKLQKEINDRQRSKSEAGRGKGF